MKALVALLIPLAPVAVWWLRVRWAQHRLETLREKGRQRKEIR